MKSLTDRLSATARFIIALLAILTLSVVGFYLLFRPPINEVWLITGFLLITTIISAIAGYAAYRLGWMNRAPNIRSALLGSYALACLLTFINVWLTARLMFTDQHDLLLGTVLLIFAGAIAMALGYLLTSSFLDRIKTLDQAAKRIADGNLSIRIPVEGRDELAGLAHTFNNMTSQLEEAQEKRKQLESLRKELLTWIGHDLQTPLTSISAIIEALSDGMVQDKETEQRYYDTAKKNISALSHLIDDMFQMAQIDAGGLELNIDSVSISDLISDTLENFTELSNQKNILIQGKVGPDLDEIQVDAQRINRVLNNLIENAIRHTPQNGTIRVTADRSNKGVIVEVSDNGEGIDPGDLPYLFDKFYRGEKTRRTAMKGTGLGLAISKGIIDAHGGEIWASSILGRTTFTFVIPQNRTKCTSLSR
ncbi:MAG: HAMP domain-containing protein [Chloroflexota bacterium]|nr:MAG: HAMP domain-containing protein [Chloroflexota bacterium]